MSKRLRLTVAMRQRLKHHASGIVVPLHEKAALDAAYKKAAPLVRHVVEEKFPPRDMKICAKYDAAQIDDCIKIKLLDADVGMFHFATGTGPLVTSMTYHGQIYLADKPATDAFEEWKAAKDAFDAAKKERVNAYHALVEGSNYLDEITSIWPEAADVIPNNNLPLALGPDQIALVQTDVQERMAA